MKHASMLFASLLVGVCSSGAWAQESAHWVAGPAAPGAFIEGGEGGHPFTVCRGRAHGGVLPGELSEGACRIGFGRREERLARYETLTVNRQRVHWQRHASEAYFEDAVEAGHWRSSEIVICRTDYQGVTHLGWAWIGECHVAVHGREVVRTEHDVLIANAQPTAWVAVSDGSLPLGAVFGRRDRGTPQYVCRGQHLGALHVGRLAGPRCIVGYGGREVTLLAYEVLVGEARVLHWNEGGPAGSLPGEVISEGAPGERESVCAALYRESDLPGRLVGRRCHIGFRGREVESSSYTVLLDLARPSAPAP